MFWQEESPGNSEHRVPDSVVDVAFRIRCARLPVDHAFALCSAIHRVLPWILEDECSGIHLIHGAESGNGWQRPDDDDYLLLPKRTRLNLRVPVARRDDTRLLCGRVIEIGDCMLAIGDATEKPLVASSTVFSRHVSTEGRVDEEHFLGALAGELHTLGVTPRKMLCGKLHTLQTPQGGVHVRSVMLADLKLHESIRLQQYGVGNLRAFGMGLFLPHKGIDAVYTASDT